MEELQPFQAPMQVAPPSWMSTGKIIRICVAVIVVAAAAYYIGTRKSGEVAVVSPSESVSPTVTDTAVPSAISNQPLTWDVLSNGEYFSQDTGTLIKLVDGTYPLKPLAGESQADYFVKIDPKLNTIGDINGDGQQDAVVILTSRAGGTGTDYQLAVVLNDHGTGNNFANQGLGDRTTIHSLAISSGAVTVDMTPFNGVRKTITYTLSGDALVAVTSPTAGWKTYTSVLYGYKFNYPEGFMITSPQSPEDSNWPPTCGFPITGVCAEMTDAFRQANNLTHTDLLGATLAVKILDKAPNAQTTEQVCATINFGTTNASAMTKKQTINGVSFYIGEMGGAAAGTSHGGKVYRTFRNNQCWEVYLGTSSTGCGPDFGGARCTTSSEGAAIANMQNTMLNSFMFTK